MILISLCIFVIGYVSVTFIITHSLCSFSGHSGDHHDVSFVDFNVCKPSNEAQRYKVLETMITHTAYCQAGDHTLEAVQWAVQNIENQANEVVKSGGDGGKIDKYILAVR